MANINLRKGGLLLSDKKSTTQQKQDLAAQLWLSYYNQVLYEKGLITEQERSRMALKINSRKPTSP